MVSGSGAAGAGALAALHLAGGTLNVYSQIGAVMLIGLAAKNGILIVEFANQLRRNGVERVEAVVEAATLRLRPILMTTAAMIFGMLPLAIGLGEGAEQQAPMGRAIIGGVITSTLLTLVVVPVVYTYLDDFGARVAVYAKRWFTKPDDAPAHTTHVPARPAPERPASEAPAYGGTSPAPGVGATES